MHAPYLTAKRPLREIIKRWDLRRQAFQERLRVLKERQDAVDALAHAARTS
jgi:hypothetical protein